MNRCDEGSRGSLKNVIFTSKARTLFCEEFLEILLEENISTVLSNYFFVETQERVKAPYAMCGF
jgi:hypothetical protein